MLGAHELLLIIRAQNQASAALGRFSRDLRALETRRALAARQAQVNVRQLRLNERIANNVAKNASLQARTGVEAARVDQTRHALTMRRLNLLDRITAAEDAQLSIDRQRTNVGLRENRLLNAELGIRGRIIAEEAKLATLRSGSALDARRGGIARERISIDQGKFHLGTQRIQRDLALQTAQARALRAGVVSGVTGRPLAGKEDHQLVRRIEIAKRNIKELEFVEKTLVQRDADLVVSRKRLSEAVAENTAAIRRSAGTVAQYSNELVINRSEIAKLEQEYAILDSRELKNFNRLRELRLALTNTTDAEAKLVLAIKAEGAAMAATAAESVRLAREQQILTAQTQELNLALRTQATERWTQISRSVTHAGRVMQLFGLVSAAAMGAAAKSAADFNTQMTRAATQARQPGQRVAATARISERLMNRVLKQMQQFPATSQEMSDSLYEIFSGTNVRNIGQATSMLRTFNMMAVAGQTDLKTMTDAGITLYNNFGEEFPNMTKAANAFFAAVRFGRMDASQFAGSLSNIVPIAKEAGLRFRDVADAMALLTRQSGARFTSRDATGLSRLIQILTRPEMMKGLKDMGVDVQDTTGKMRPLLDIITEIKKQMDFRNIKPGPDVLNFFKTVSARGGGGASRGFTGTIQAQRAFAFLINNSKQYHTVAKQVNDDNNEFIQSYKALAQTPGVRWQVFVNQMKALVIVLGQGAIPALMSVGQYVANLVRWFNNLSPQTRRAIGYFLALISVGTLFVGVLSSIVGGLASFYFGMRLLQATRAATAVQGAAEGTAMLGAELGAVNPILAAVLAGMFLLGVAYYKYPQQTKAVIEYTGQLIGKLFALDQQLLRLVEHPWNIIISPKFKLPKQVEDFLNNRLMRKGFRAAAKEFPGIGPLIQVMDLFKQLGNSNKQPFRNIKTQPLSDLAMTLKATRNVGKQVAEANTQAALSGVKATKTFVQLYRALLAARKEVEKHPNSYKAQYRYQMALSNLQQNVSKQQYNAAVKTAGGIANTQKKYSDATIIAEAKKVHQFERLAKHQKTFQAWKNYYKALDKLQADATSAQMQAVDQIFDSTGKKADKATKAIENKYQQVLQNLQTVYQNFYQQNQNAFGQLFQGAFMQSNMMQSRIGAGEKILPTDLIKDLRSQVQDFRSWRKDLDALAARGLPEGMRNQILALGPDAAKKQIVALRRMTPAQLKEYEKLWRAGQTAIHQATMRDVNSQLKDWRRHGRRMALAIAAGLRDENTVLESSLRKMITNMFPELAKKNKTTRARNAPQRLTSTGTSGPRVIHHHGPTYKVTTQADPRDVKRQLKDANWHHRNK